MKVDQAKFAELLKTYKTTRMSGYDFIEKLKELGCTPEMAMFIHEAATRTY